MAVVDQLQASNKSPTGKHAQHSGAICYKLGKTKCGCLGILAQTDRKSKQSRKKVTDNIFALGAMSLVSELPRLACSSVVAEWW